MSWQRIDENTYIDDTLVTCAEYQLFIDEMREQGKYHQPDHWTSYQFLVGQAHEPILGVRYSDAESFCEWLTKRENGNWRYRLPTQMEATDHPIWSIGNQMVVGYWTMRMNSLFELIWSGHAPNNARFLKDAPNFDFAYSRALDFSRAPTRDLDIVVDRALSQALNRARVRALDIAFDIDRARIQHRNDDLDHLLAQALDRSLLDSKLARDHDLDIVVDIFTLQERIAGRSPAFEGIRLFKERIK